MPKRLPYRATTTSGNQFDFEFPLHPETGDSVQVSNLLNAVLDGLDRELKLLGDVSNGDVLQAVAMALAVRTRMLGNTSPKVDAMVLELVESALGARVEPGRGNLPPDAPRDVH